MHTLAGHWALVTGASSGIGADVARELAARGLHCILVARRRERLEALASELSARHGVQSRVEVADLAAPGAADALVARLDAAELAVSVLINNAGFGTYGPFVDMPAERLGEMLRLNVLALTELTHRLAPRMVARRMGYIMNVASIGGYLPVPGYAAYAATKAFVRNFTEALDAELAGTGVHALSVSPGNTATEFASTAGTVMSDFGLKTAMTSATCARIAVRAMLRGRRSVVTGRLNALMMWLLRFMPRRTQAAAGRRSMAMAIRK